MNAHKLLPVLLLAFAAASGAVEMTGTTPPDGSTSLPAILESGLPAGLMAVSTTEAGSTANTLAVPGRAPE